MSISAESFASFKQIKSKLKAYSLPQGHIWPFFKAREPNSVKVWSDLASFYDCLGYL